MWAAALPGRWPSARSWAGATRAWLDKLAVFAGKRIARRYAGRLVPLIGSPIGAVQNAGATKDLGRRALAYYGGAQARP